jgi:REP element-mobilizing transposase RayT
MPGKPAEIPLDRHGWQLSFIKSPSMSTYRQLLFHIVFSVNFRQPQITTDVETPLYNYMAGICRNLHCRLLHINGTTDHIHILTDLHPSVALSDLVKTIKVASSLWLKSTGLCPDFAGWQEGYAAFSHSPEDIPILTDYLRRQKQHHQQETAREEFIRLLTEHGIQYDPRYV